MPSKYLKKRDVDFGVFFDAGMERYLKIPNNPRAVHMIAVSIKISLESFFSLPQLRLNASTG
jgi:hypothetical protein